MDSKGNLRYGWKGNPIELSQHQVKKRKVDIPRNKNNASTLFASGNKPGKQNQEHRQVKQQVHPK